MEAVNPARSIDAVMKKLAETYPEEWGELPDDECGPDYCNIEDDEDGDEASDRQ